MDKKIKLLSWVLFVLFVSGCASINWGNTEKTISKIAVRKVALYVGINNPELINPGINLCNEVLDTDDETLARELLKVAVNTAMEKIGVTDPFIAQDVSDLMDILDIDMAGNIGNFKLGELKFIVVGMREGLEQAKSVKKAEV